MSLYAWLFSFRGRLQRQGFWQGMGICLLLLMLATWLLDGYTNAVSAVVIVLLWPMLAVLVKRLHDRGKPGWFAALLIIPVFFPGIGPYLTEPLWQWAIARFMPLFVLVIFALDCGLFRGQPDRNQHGDVPQPVRFRR